MSWLGYISISVLVHSTAILILRVLIKEDKKFPITFLVIYQTFVGVIVFASGFIGGYLKTPTREDMQLLPWIILSWLLYAGANYCMFESLKRIQASKFIIAFSLRVFITTFAAWIILSETLTLPEIIGAVLIFLGIVFSNHSKIKGENVYKGLMYAILGAVFFGIANVNDRYILQSLELFTYIGLSFIGTAAILGVFQTKKLLEGKILFQSKSLIKIGLLSVFYGVYSVTFFAALQKGDSASQVVSVSLVSVIVTVLFAMIFLKERDNAVLKIIGALCAFAGVLLLV